MTNVSVAFREFVKTQPADRKIDHGAGWRECAVGEFLIETGRVDENSRKLFVIDHTSETPESLQNLVENNVLEPEYYTVMQVLGSEELLIALGHPHIAEVDLRTYGDLQKYLEENE